MININSLSYTKNNSEILKNINTSIYDGEITGIIGESGSGKTILLKALAGQLKDYTGEILFNNISVKSIPSRDLEKQISSLFNYSSNDLIDDTIFNFLLQSRKSYKKILSPFTDYDLQITEDNMDLFDLNDYRERKVLTVSDGILKKIMLASAFIKKTDLLLLDNPTSDIDIHSIELLQKAITKYVIDGDKIIIIASNDLNFIFETADKILIIKEGEIDTEKNTHNIDAQFINKYFNAEVLVSKNIYNGKPIIHQFSKGAG